MLIDTIKNKDTEDWFEKKSRLCIAPWGDQEKWTVLIMSPTTQRSSQRTILSIAAMTTVVRLKISGLRRSTSFHSIKNLNQPSFLLLRTA